MLAKLHLYLYKLNHLFISHFVYNVQYYNSIRSLSAVEYYLVKIILTWFFFSSIYKNYQIQNLGKKPSNNIATIFHKY